MKYYVVIDTNVLVSAVLKAHSVPGSIAGGYPSIIREPSVTLIPHKSRLM